MGGRGQGNGMNKVGSIVVRGEQGAFWGSWGFWCVLVGVPMWLVFRQDMSLLYQ